MAILSPDELAEMRRSVTARFPEQDWDRAVINAAFQALEDEHELTSRGQLRDVVVSSMAPFVPTAALQDAIKSAYLKQKARREGA